MEEIKLMQPRQVFYEDVTEGMELPKLVKGPIDVMMLAKFGSMYGDFYPSHYDHKWATEVDRIPGAVVYGVMLITYLGIYSTNWISPNGILKKIKTQVRAQTFVGDTVTYTGKVAKKYMQDGQGMVDIEIVGTKQDNVKVILGWATCLLPLK
uniref:MaoC-like domain-containing protein n=1 Tax=uncultured Dehalococcoidia bacterium TaxID=498747 RepID=A0A871Y6U6_9CHLR|nr:hypothetical protein HULAa30F3_00004 [uncultured Dehalococcoidia bacterium]